jgi:hypothetical protein
MAAIRQVVAVLSGIDLAGGIPVGAGVAIAPSAGATCADEGGTFERGLVHSRHRFDGDLANTRPSGKVTNNPWTETVTTGTTTTYHGNGPGSQIDSTSTSSTAWPTQVATRFPGCPAAERRRHQ